jgi:CTP:molybdopterin cytidylyltransferase MocA
VLIFHAAAPSDAGPLVRVLAEARHSLANRQREAFLAAGADVAEVVAGPPDGLSFGERLAAEMRPRTGNARVGVAGTGVSGPGDNVVLGSGGRTDAARGGIIVLGSGSIPLARAVDLRRFVEVAAGSGGHALANNRYSADVVAISRASILAELPPLPADNALPRWLEERAGVEVSDLRSRWRLGVDIDTPLDLLLLGLPGSGAAATDAERSLAATAPLIGERLAALSDVLTNRRAELLVAGRISATTLRWLESGVACRVRALVEERGLRAASGLAHSGATAGSRPPRSVLGELLDRDGPESLARTVAALADAAVIDTRVLLAHRHGPDESAWPAAEDRFGSDLLLPATIADPWLRALTESATSSDHPILLGGHTLVSGGLRLLAERARAGKRR